MKTPKMDSVERWQMLLGELDAVIKDKQSLGIVRGVADTLNRYLSMYVPSEKRMMEIMDEIEDAFYNP